MSDSTGSPSPLVRLADLGAAGQVLVPGIYVWAVTVAPAGFGKGAPWYAGFFAIVALAALGGGALLERAPSLLPAVSSAPARRALTLWAFVGASIATWVAFPEALSAARLEMARGIAGLLGWGVFAYAAAAPGLAPVTEADEEAPGAVPAARVEAGLKARGFVARGDAIVVGAGGLLAAALQVIGWDVATPERGVLVRLVALACGIAIVTAAAAVASARHGRRGRRKRVRLRGWVWVGLLLLTLLAGLLYRIAD